MQQTTTTCNRHLISLFFLACEVYLERTVHTFNTLRRSDYNCMNATHSRVMSEDLVHGHAIHRSPSAYKFFSLQFPNVVTVET